MTLSNRYLELAKSMPDMSPVNEMARVLFIDGAQSFSDAMEISMRFYEEQVEFFIEVATTNGGVEHTDPLQEAFLDAVDDDIWVHHNRAEKG